MQCWELCEGQGVDQVETAGELEFEFGVSVQTGNGVAWAARVLLQFGTLEWRAGLLPLKKISEDVNLQQLEQIDVAAVV